MYNGDRPHAWSKYLPVTAIVCSIWNLSVTWNIVFKIVYKYTTARTHNCESIKFAEKRNQSGLFNT